MTSLIKKITPLFQVQHPKFSKIITLFLTPTIIIFFFCCWILNSHLAKNKSRDEKGTGCKHTPLQEAHYATRLPPTHSPPNKPRWLLTRLSLACSGPSSSSSRDRQAACTGPFRTCSARGQRRRISRTFSSGRRSCASIGLRIPWRTR